MLIFVLFKSEMTANTTNITPSNKAFTAMFAAFTTTYTTTTR
jgi:hypothetical protein